jgi:hypothetical protein
VNNRWVTLWRFAKKFLWQIGTKLASSLVRAADKRGAQALEGKVAKIIFFWNEPT